MSSTAWPCLELNCESAFSADEAPIDRLATGEIAAVVFRRVFHPDECQSLVRHLIDEELMYESHDLRIEDRAIPAGRANRYQQADVNPAHSERKRIDIGTSLGNLGDDREEFFADVSRTEQLFGLLFAERENPLDVVYDNLAKIAPGKRVVTAYEPDGRQYGPAIFRVHYGGFTYAPHFDSVRNREQRTGYAVYKYAHQLAGVLCIQNATREGVSAQAILHRQFWCEEISPVLEADRFHSYADENKIANFCVELEPGDLYFFNTGVIHEVPGVSGDLPRIVLATFIGYADNEDEIMVWS
jgi:hypothetical protein